MNTLRNKTEELGSLTHIELFRILNRLIEADPIRDSRVQITGSKSDMGMVDNYSNIPPRDIYDQINTRIPGATEEELGEMDRLLFTTVSRMGTFAPVIGKEFVTILMNLQRVISLKQGFFQSKKPNSGIEQVTIGVGQDLGKIISPSVS